MGALAGFTIFFGLPIAFLPERKRLKGLLNAVATGVLIFLLVEVLHDAIGMVEESVQRAATGEAASLAVFHASAILVAGLVIGLLGLVLFEMKFIRNHGMKMAGNDKAKYLSLMIAMGIGLHNFSEGLAIGQSFVNGAIKLALLLVIGFALHNATEGFGIAGPLHGTRPSWKFLFMLGLIGGGPTFLGTMVGSAYASPLLSLLFLSLAGGAIIYVVKELLYHGRIAGEDMMVMAGLLLGFFLGVGTEMIIELAKVA